MSPTETFTRQMETDGPGRPSSREAVQNARVAARKAAAGLMRQFVARGLEDEAHCERVAIWSRRLAKELGLSSDRVLDIELGALLHDIGYISLSSAHFPRKRPAKPEDWLEFQRHPELGVALLERIPVLRRAIPLVAAHEEHFDGTGYPKGQRGTEIPISARIFHVVDAYEAMTNDLAWRAPTSDADARAQIELDKGARHDPIVCAALDCIEPAEWCDLVVTLR
jgi:HD-GYP domain-containing protein (c-di-GMP phosphodiesterase class II)